LRFLKAFDIVEVDLSLKRDPRGSPGFLLQFLWYYFKKHLVPFLTPQYRSFKCHFLPPPRFHLGPIPNGSSRCPPFLDTPRFPLPWSTALGVPTPQRHCRPRLTTPSPLPPGQLPEVSHFLNCHQARPAVFPPTFQAGGPRLPKTFLPRAPLFGTLLIFPSSTTLYTDPVSVWFHFFSVFFF